MQTGIVKWYDKERGYGFISCDEGFDAFVHATQIHDNKKELNEGQSVTLSIEPTEKGPMATNVHKM